MNDISLADISKISKRHYNSLLSYVINLSTSDNNARKLLLYFYEASKESPNHWIMNNMNENWAKRLGIKNSSFSASFCHAKKTGLLIVYGRGIFRCLKFNHELLEQKMSMLLYIQQKTEVIS